MAVSFSCPHQFIQGDGATVELRPQGFHLLQPVRGRLLRAPSGLAPGPRSSSWSIRVDGPLVVFAPAGEGFTVQLAHLNSHHNGLIGVNRGNELNSISDAVGPWMLQAIPDHRCRPIHHSDQSADDVTPGHPPVEASASGQAAIELLVLVKDPFGGRIKVSARLDHQIPYRCGG